MYVFRFSLHLKYFYFSMIKILIFYSIKFSLSNIQTFKHFDSCPINQKNIIIDNNLTDNIPEAGNIIGIDRKIKDLIVAFNIGVDNQ